MTTETPSFWKSRATWPTIIATTAVLGIFAAANQFAGIAPMAQPTLQAVADTSPIVPQPETLQAGIGGSAQSGAGGGIAQAQDTKTEAPRAAAPEDAKAGDTKALAPSKDAQGKASAQDSPAAPAKRTAQPEVRDRLKECMATWDSKTGMSKRDWEATCKRTLIEKPTMEEATGLHTQGKTAGSSSTRKAGTSTKGAQQSGPGF